MKRARRWSLFAALTLACAAPRARTIPSATEPDDPAPLASAASAPAPEGPPSPEPDDAPEPPKVLLLEVPGHSPAIVSLPGGKRPSEPLLIALHGAGDGPQWECAVWREILGARGVILCPAGKPLGRTPDDGYYHPDHRALEALVQSSMAALQDLLGDRLDASPAVFAGYSQGAMMGAQMIVPHAAAFPRLILVEGGYSEWNVPRGKAFRDHGGVRILFACGTAHCEKAARRSAAWVERGGVATRIESDPRAGHTYGGSVAERVRGALEWVLEGDARWVR